MRRLLLLSVKIVGALAALLVVAVAACIVIGVTIDLSFLKPGVEASARAALGREVKIDGPVVFEFSTWPAIQVNDVSIANRPGASQPVFFRAGHARLQIALLPLLKRKIQIGEIVARKVSLNLENDARGRPNWVFGEPKTGANPPGGASEKKNGKAPAVDTESETGTEPIGFRGLNRLSLQDIALTYRDAALGKTLAFQLDELVGQAAPGQPISLNVRGRLQKYGYDIELRGDTLEEMLAKDKPWTFTLTGDVAGKKISTRGDLMARGRQPQINLAFGIRDVNVGAILAALGIVEGIQASVGDAGFKVTLNGNSLQQLLEQSTMLFSVRDAHWRVDIPNTQARVDITNLSGAIRVEKEKAVSMDLAGRIGQTPVKLRITSAPLVRYITDPNEIPLKIHALLADTQLDFSSQVKLPISSRNMELALKVSGKRMDDLNDLLRLELPPIGPILLDTRLKITGKGYDLSTLKIAVGESRLSGGMNLDTSRPKTRLEVKLVSDRIQIDDFTPRGKKGARTKASAAEASPARRKPQKSAARGTSPQGRRGLLSDEVLGLLDARIRVEARQVLSGKDKLGSAHLKLSLQDGRLAIEPLRVDVPGGGVRLDGDYLPAAAGITVNVKTAIDKFDLGILFRRLKPGTDMGGIFSLDAALHATAPDLQHVMESAGGHFNFMLAPRNFSAGIIDLWAVNLLAAVMKKASEKDKSRINCLVVRLNMQDGLMKENAIYMDTTRMSISGRAEINFKTRRIDVLLAPKAKKPQFFSLAVPIKVKGTFDDFGVGIGMTRLAGTIISFVTSPVHVPIRRIFARKVPADGRDACMAAWAGGQDRREKPHKQKP